MIIPLENPPKVVLTGNPVIARLASNNYITSPGTQAVFVFRFSADEDPDDTFIISSPGAGEFTFVFKTTPNPNSSTQVRTKGGLSDTAWMQSIRATMESNYYLDRHYFISDVVVSGNPAIKLVSRQAGSSWTLTYSESSSASNFVPVTNTAGTNKTTQDNFRILIETYLKGLVNYRLKGAGDLIAVDSEGVGKAQINAYLAESLTDQFAWPPQAITPVGFRNQLAARAFFKYGESYGTPEAVHKMTKSTEFIALQGRLPRKRMVWFYNQYPTLNDWFIATKRFLTWQPVVKTTFSDAPEKLFWLHYREDIDQVKVRVKRVFADGTSATIDLTSLFSIDPWSVLEIDTSPAILAPGLEVAELHVWVSSSANVALSVIQKYLISRNLTVNLQHFLFENPFGVYDCVSFNGELVEEDDYERIQEEVYDPSLYNQAKRRYRNQKVNQDDLFTATSSFFIDQDMLLWMDDLLNSFSVYEVISGQLHEIVIENGKIFKFRSNEFVRSVTMTYRRISPDQVYQIQPVSVLSEVPIIDEVAPIPQFSAGPISGLSGFEEMYLPGNAWIELSEAMAPASSFTLTAVFRAEKGGVVLFCDEEGDNYIVLGAGGDEITLYANSTSYLVDIGLDIRNKYVLFQFSVTGEGIQVHINGVLKGSNGTSDEITFGITRFGHKHGSFGYFSGRLNDVRSGNTDDLTNPDVILTLAERYGLPVPSSNWMNSYDDETRTAIQNNQYTRDDVVKGYMQMARAPMPYFDPAPGHDVAPYPISILHEFGPDATMHYTDNGTEPTTDSPVFNPETLITIEQDTIIKTIAVVEGYLPSQVVTGVFTLTQATAPTFVPAGGEFTSPKAIVIESEQGGAEFFYNIDSEEDPTIESTEFDTSVILTAPTDEIVERVVKAIATVPGYNPSPVATAEYSISAITKGFQLEFTVAGDATGRTVTLPFTNNGTYDAYIDWGDGTSLSHLTAYNGSQRTHVYATGGTYIVEITGSAPGFSFNNTGHKAKLTDIIYWGDPDKFDGFEYLRAAFSGCSNCASLGIGRIYAKAYGALSLYDAFTGMVLITGIPTGLFDELTGLTTYAFRSAFLGCTSLVSIPVDLFRYNVLVSLEAFYLAFYGCTNLEGVPESLFRYNTAVAANGFAYAFYGCPKLQLNQWIFYASGEESTRFFNRTTNLSNCFYRTSFSGVQGTAPDFWNCNFGSSTPTRSNCYAGAGNSGTSLTNYADIPSNWKT